MPRDRRQCGNTAIYCGKSQILVSKTILMVLLLWQCCSRHYLFYPSEEGTYLYVYLYLLQRNPFSILQIQDNILQSNKDLNLSKLSFSVFVTEVQLFELSASCVREKNNFRTKMAKLNMQQYLNLCCNLDEGFGSISTRF